MRNLIFLLLLANIVYFLWNTWVVEPEVNTGIIVHEESELTPKVALAPPEAVADAADDVENPASEAPTVVCLSLGPYADIDAAGEAVDALLENEIDGRVRAANGRVFVGHWTQVQDVANRADANRKVAQLQAGGLEEAYIAGNADDGWTISLGLFSERPRAELVRDQAIAAGVEAIVVDRTREGEQFWVDTTTNSITALDDYIDEDIGIRVEQDAAGACSETPAE